MLGMFLRHCGRELVASAGESNMAAEVLAFLGKAGKRLAGWRLQELTHLQVKETVLVSFVGNAPKDQSW